MYFFQIQNLTFLRHYIKKFKKNGDQSNYSILYTLNLFYAGFKPVFVLVVPSKLSWGRTFENLISGVACLI